MPKEALPEMMVGAEKGKSLANKVTFPMMRMDKFNSIRDLRKLGEEDFTQPNYASTPKNLAIDFLSFSKLCL